MKNNDEKYKQVLEFFEKEKIKLPEEIKNTLKDVFDENENINDIYSYFKEDLKDFEDDLRLKKYVYVDKNNEKSFIEVDNVFSYYGIINYSLEEKTVFLDGNEVLEEITMIENGASSTLDDPEDFAIIVVEKLEWRNNEKETRKSDIFLFCPESIGEKYA